MVLSFHIGFRHCGKKTISVIVDYTIKSRELHPTTVFYVVDVELIDGGETKDHCCIRFLVPTIEAFRKSFHDFLMKFIWRVLITDFVLSSIGAFELMEFQNKLEQLDFPKQQQTPLNILRDYMISKNIALIEHDDFFIGDAIFNDDPALATFRYKNTNDKFMSHEELHNIKMQGSEAVFRSFNLIDIFRHNIYYFIV